MVWAVPGRVDDEIATGCHGTEGGGVYDLPVRTDQLGLGFEIVVPVLLLAWGGHWLDGRLGSGPWCLVLGAFVGMAVAFYNLFRRVLPPREDHGGKSD